jgi:hypothetical protein
VAWLGPPCSRNPYGEAVVVRRAQVRAEPGLPDVALRGMPVYLAEACTRRFGSGMSMRLLQERILDTMLTTARLGGRFCLHLSGESRGICGTGRLRQAN